VESRSTAARWLAAWLVAGSLIAAARDLRAETLRVPGDHPTIQAAIDAAAPGDVIRVAAGTFTERIDLRGKRLRLAGAGADRTVVAAGSPGSTVTVALGEGEDTVLEGMTLRGGTGTSLGGGLLQGGGLFLFGTSPTVRDCVVEGNAANLGGGAIVCGNRDLGPVRFERCVFRGNSAGTAGGFGGQGGALVVDQNGSAELRDCLFEENGGRLGGALFASAASVLLVERTRFRSNSAVEAGGAVHLSDRCAAFLIACTVEDSELRDVQTAEGGGIYSEESELVLLDSVVRGSRALRPTARTSGGGVLVRGGTVRLQGNRIEDNVATLSGGGVQIVESGAAGEFELVSNVIAGNRAGSSGGGVAYPNAADSWVRFRSNVITRNVADSRGGGIFAAGGSPRPTPEARFELDTLVANEAPVGPAIRWESRRRGVFANGIVYHHDPSRPPIEVTLGVLDVVGSDVEGGWPGEGNFDADPLFVDRERDLHLRPGSPCVDVAGEGFLELVPPDVDGDARGVDGDLDGEGGIDVGADELRPGIAVRFGRVHGAAGELVSPLRVNGSAGDVERAVRVATGGSVRLDLDAAPAGPDPAAWALYVYEDAPDPYTIARQPLGLGLAPFPTFLSHERGSPNLPIRVLSTFEGHERRIGRSRPPRGVELFPAPTTLSFPRGLRYTARLTLVALLEDLESRAEVPVSLTNAVVVEIRD